jgi:hypothetical protein
VIDVVQDPQNGPRILVHASGPAVDATGIAQGFSGSPVYCPDAMGTMRNAGAISEGVGEYGNHVALVTPIELMLGEPVTPPSSAPRLAVRTTPLLGPLTVGGLSPAILGLLEQAGRRVGRVVLAAQTGPFAGFPVQPLVPGASVAASYSIGAISLGAVGTVTYRDGQTVYAFGHELDGAGRRSLLLQDAYVYYVVNNPDPLTGASLKLAAPGHLVGNLTSDTPNAVIGEVGPPPPSVPVDVSARDLDTGGSLTLQSQVADETDVGLPLGGSSVDMVAPLEVAQAATQIYRGPPANESGDMCLRVYIRESSAPLGFCNRYVGTGVAGDSGIQPPELATAAATDVTTAFGLLEQIQFATLHVTRVVADIDARRGLAQATILSAHAPTHAKPGHSVTVRLLVRVFRGRLRTIAIRVRIPRKTRGVFIATIDGPATPSSLGSSPASLAGSLSLSLSLGGPPPGPSQPPDSIRSLRKAIAAIHTYDGLVLKSPGHKSQHVYRDPGLLITGGTTVAVPVG